MTTRHELVQKLAKVSHETYIRQRVRDKNETREAVVADPNVGSDPTPHDLERAEEAVKELERLEVLKPLVESES